MAMSFAVAGLAAPGVAVANPGCVTKTYPGFWRDLEEATASAR
jgi:3-phosphoshikimate 1-carboxyvinyltransferase